MKFSIIHPSRNRIQRAKKAVANAINRFNFDNGDSLEYIISIDDDDKFQKEYFEFCNQNNLILTVNNNRSMVDATNIAAKLSTGDLIILLSDDFELCDNWNVLLKNKIIDQNSLYAIHVNDGISKGDILSIPIISKMLYQKLGYVYHPEFFSLFADNALFDTCKILNCLIDANDILFQHHHYINNKAVYDETYQKENSKYAYESGKLLYQKLKERNFDL